MKRGSLTRARPIRSIARGPPHRVLGPDGETADVFSYANAIRERVFIPVLGVDQDADGILRLMGRTPGYDTNGNAVQAMCDNGKNAMIGKSYDGTFANGVASTGVDGLTTIVPISGISDWYDHSRMGGIRFNTHYPRASRTRSRRTSAPRSSASRLRATTRSARSRAPR